MVKKVRMLKRGTFRATRSAGKALNKRIKAIASSVVKKDRPAEGTYHGEVNYFIGSPAGARGRFLRSFRPDLYCANSIYGALTNNASAKTDPEDGKAALTANVDNMWISTRKCRLTYTVTNTGNVASSLMVYSMGIKKSMTPAGSAFTVEQVFQDALNKSSMTAFANGSILNAEVWTYAQQLNNDSSGDKPGLDILPNFGLMRVEGIRRNFNIYYAQRIILQPGEMKTFVLKMPRYFWKYIDTAGFSTSSPLRALMKNRLILFYSQGSLCSVDGNTPDVITSTGMVTPTNTGVNWSGTGIAINERYDCDYSYGSFEAGYTRENVVDFKHLSNGTSSAPTLEAFHANTLVSVAAQPASVVAGSVPVATS